MKNFLLIAVMLVLPALAQAQPWKANLPVQKPNQDLTFFDYQKAFYDYWEPYQVVNGFYMENGVERKAVGWKQFKRWEYEMEQKCDPVTGKFPVKSAMELVKEYSGDNAAMPLASWTVKGPIASGGGYAGIGRINCIAFHPSNNSIYWVGAASGGLWVTTNNGASWSCLTDGNGALAVSDIVIPTDYAISNTIYIATGDKDHWDNRSVGVLKSTNGGVTWNTTGISYTIAQGKMVSRLLLSPVSNQVIVAATTDGVYRTSDGGATWNTQLTATYFIDMEYKPGDFNTFYGSTTDGKIYKSANGGASWGQVFNDANVQRVELAVSPNQPTWVYSVMANYSAGLYGVYKSTNSGDTFSQVAGSTPNMLGWESNGSGTGGQGWYDLCLAASPTNAGTVLLGGINTWRSLDGGVTWAIVNHWWGDGVPAAHADKHWLVFRSNGDLFEGNDGGVYLSANNGTSWTDKTNGMIISQMYKLGVSATVANEVITGLQDNGTKLYTGGGWADVKGGDGMECLIDYTNVNIQYGTYVNGQISRTTNHWASSTNIQPAGAGNGSWVTPYIIDPINPMILYAGYADVWKTTDRGTAWTKISTMNTTNKIRSMAIAPSNTQVLYVADPTVLWKTTDGGTNWTNITGTLPAISSNITYLCVKHDDPNTIWVSLGNYNATRVFESTNGGTTWTNISTGLPEIPVYSIVQNKQSSTQVQLYAGTELGVYFKKGSDNWVAFNTGLPNVQIGELEIYYSASPGDSKLRAATFGRGLWESPVYYSSVAMTYITSSVTQTNTSVVSPGLQNQEIIGIQVVTNGDLSPLNITSFNFNTTGSTNPATDIVAAKVFYTGTSNVYGTTVQFGSVVTNPNGTFTVSGSQALAGGSNFFWLAYDVPFTATTNNYLDAQCLSLTVTSARTPTNTSPSGNRKIGISWCSANGTVCDEYIKIVAAGAINNNTSCTPGGYGDYTSLSTTVQPGGTIPITVTNSIPYIGDSCGIWVDWNHNGLFTDDAPVVVSGGPGTFTATLACPSTTFTGPKRMRIRIHWTEEPTAPCGTAHYGEVEDYTILVSPPSILPLTGTVANGQERCYSATQVIQTGGTGTPFEVQNGARATLIAGQRITFLPGSRVLTGGYLRGYISGNQYCYPPAVMDALLTLESPLPEKTGSFYKLFPNPTTGIFYLALNYPLPEKISLEIYGIRGEKVMAEEIPGTPMVTMSLEGRPSGIYFLRLNTGTRNEVIKLIKQ